MKRAGESPEPTRLTDLQRWVAGHLQSRRALERSSTAVEEAELHLTGNERLRPVDQLEVYREQFWLRHTASLVEDFPGVGGILGQSEWEGLVEGYLGTHPPESYTLRELGRQFPDYVERRTDLSQHDLCTDMARLEWRFIELFDAAECPPLDLQKLGTLPPGTLETGRIALSPALGLLRVDYPVADLRARLLERRTLTDAAPVEIPARDAQCLVLYRGADRRLYHRPVSPEAFALLEALERGTALVAACQLALERHPEHAHRLEQNVGAWFQEWARRGWIVDVVPDPEALARAAVASER